MEWTNSLKRTRNGSIYSETMSRLTQLNGHATKRRKTMAAKEHAISGRCHLESLPAELLQQIFLTSMNGNLITASPRIAVKLSGTKAVYRAAFILAFYSHDVDNMFSIYGLHYLVPILDVSLCSWDVRSLTRAVLNSRWCTWGQVKLWLTDNVRYAVTQLLAIAKPTNSARNIDAFMQGETDLGDLMIRCWSAEDEAGRTWRLEPHLWDIRITRDSDIYENEWDLDAEMEEDYELDAFTAEWRHELNFQCQMRIFGVLTIGDEKSSNYYTYEDDPFRNLVELLIGFDAEDIKPQPSSLDFWQLLDERAVRATRNPHWLRETLAVEHFFYPEDQPFKVPARLYRAAAVADIELEDALYDQRGSYVPVLHVLFEVDPLSLPRQDPALMAWAARARKRIFDFFRNMAVLRDELEDRRYARGGSLNNYDRNKYRARKLEHKYCYELDWKIVFYIVTGSLGQEAFPNTSAPEFAERLGWLGERLNPSPDRLDEAEKLSYPNSTPRDVDIFGEDPNYDFEHHYDLDQAIMENTLCKLFGRNEEQLELEAEVILEGVERAEAQYALTAEDDYYKSADHDNYGGLFERPGVITSSGRVFEFNDWDDDDNDESEDEHGSTDSEGSNNPPGVFWWGLLDDKALVVHRNLTDLDLAILFPDDHHPIPSKDTELIEPLYGAPKWFHPTDKPYFEELH